MLSKLPLCFVDVFCKERAKRGCKINWVICSIKMNSRRLSEHSDALFSILQRNGHNRTLHYAYMQLYAKINMFQAVFSKASTLKPGTMEAVWEKEGESQGMEGEEPHTKIKPSSISLAPQSPLNPGDIPVMAFLSSPRGLVAVT